MALRSDWSDTTCPIAYGADALSDPWVLLVLRELFTGRTHFDVIRDATGISDSVLARRLKLMTERDLIRKTADGYALTPDGESSLPVLHAYSRFGRVATARDNWGLTITCAVCREVPASSDWCPTCGHALTTQTTLWARNSMGARPFHLLTGTPA